MLVFDLFSRWLLFVIANVLVAECPRRVWLLCRLLYGIDGGSDGFVPLPGESADYILNRVSTIPNLADHLQPCKLSCPRFWRVPQATAPNKS